MKNLLLFLLTMSLFACENIAPANTSDISGNYEVITDPVRCAMPSVTKLNIKVEAEKITISGTQFFEKKNFEIQNIKLKTIPEGMELIHDGKSIGKWVKDEYRDYATNKMIEANILYLQTTYQSMMIEFMGKK